MIQELLRKTFILFSATIVRYLMAFPMTHPQIWITFPWIVLPTINGCTVIASQSNDEESTSTSQASGQWAIPFNIYTPPLRRFSEGGLNFWISEGVPSLKFPKGVTKGKFLKGTTC
jgi:hypothetical protein